MQYVYLMVDLRSYCFKIGLSKNPKYRETTLQAEQPHVMLFAAWEGNREVELDLHDTFSHKRIRGEWFRLTFHDLNILFFIMDFRTKHPMFSGQMPGLYSECP